MFNLDDAELVVTTRFSIGSGSENGERFCLSDYSSLEEFFADCAATFSNEENPEYVFQHWENIPEGMVTERWLSPNFFEMHDALQSIDDEHHIAFFNRCKTYRWDIASDDPHKLVAEFEYAMSDLLKSEDEQYCQGEDELLDTAYTALRIAGGAFIEDYD